MLLRNSKTQKIILSLIIFSFSYLSFVILTSKASALSEPLFLRVNNQNEPIQSFRVVAPTNKNTNTNTQAPVRKQTGGNLQTTTVKVREPSLSEFKAGTPKTRIEQVNISVPVRSTNFEETETKTKQRSGNLQTSNNIRINSPAAAPIYYPTQKELGRIAPLPITLPLSVPAQKETVVEEVDQSLHQKQLIELEALKAQLATNPDYRANVVGALRSVRNKNLFAVVVEGRFIKGDKIKVYVNDIFVGESSNENFTEMRRAIVSRIQINGLSLLALQSGRNEITATVTGKDERSIESIKSTPYTINF